MTKYFWKFALVAGRHCTFIRISLAHVGSSTAAFAIAEQLARRGARDEQIMEVIGHQPTSLSIEEQQIEQSLQRLDDRLLHIQETAGFNGIAFHNRH